MQPSSRSRSASFSAQSSERARRFLRGALGMVSTQSFPAIIGTADAMMKSADVHLVGYEKTGSGHCTAIVRGGVADVRMAVEAGTETAKQFGQFISASLIPRPLPNLEAVLPICARLDELDQVGHGPTSNQAVGLLETRGFPAMVGAADAMTKAAEITLVAHETIGDGLCTIIIRGSLPNVAIAVDAGMHEAERIGELHSVMVIPRPLGDLEQSLPKPKLAAQKPVRLPLSLAEKEKELVSLPEATATPTPERMPLPDLAQIPAESE
ncbi:MAG: BMC domain-containing protein [Leptolyngbya sp. SIO4C5]|nr:BMC domain-containing protein [Leptolyngbya sp. SIO4C5]